MSDAFSEFAKKEKECEKTGKIIVLIIGIITLILTSINIISNVYDFAYNLVTNGSVDFKMILYILNFVLTVLFMRGFDWVRVWFGAVMAWNAIWAAFGFFVTIRELDWWHIILYIIAIAYCTTTAILLFASRSVKEYLYVRKNG